MCLGITYLQDRSGSPQGKESVKQQNVGLLRGAQQGAKIATNPVKNNANTYAAPEIIERRKEETSKGSVKRTALELAALLSGSAMGGVIITLVVVTGVALTAGIVMTGAEIGLIVGVIGYVVYKYQTGWVLNEDRQMYEKTFLGMHLERWVENVDSDRLSDSDRYRFEKEMEGHRNYRAGVLAAEQKRIADQQQKEKEDDEKKLQLLYNPPQQN